MKQFLIPIALLCFTMACLTFVHIDNMNKISKENIVLEIQDVNMDSKSTPQ
ncbi:hypothetical protein [Aquimarina sp. 2304DJ70-9]|uniref:hypothetical protein n=1 Tax=Aquimarina penaris TaxID=3231044 RepID=UPI003461F4EB